MTNAVKGLVAIVASILGLIGCSSWTQTPNTVLVQSPDNNDYQAEQDSGNTAAAHLIYAALSANVYERTHKPTSNQTPLAGC